MPEMSDLDPKMNCFPRGEPIPPTRDLVEKIEAILASDDMMHSRMKYLRSVKDDPDPSNPFVILATPFSSEVYNLIVIEGLVGVYDKRLIDSCSILKLFHSFDGLSAFNHALLIAVLNNEPLNAVWKQALKCVKVPKTNLQEIFKKAPVFYIWEGLAQLINAFLEYENCSKEVYKEEIGDNQILLASRFSILRTAELIDKSWGKIPWNELDKFTKTTTWEEFLNNASSVLRGSMDLDSDDIGKLIELVNSIRWLAQYEKGPAAYILLDMLLTSYYLSQ